MSWLLSTLAGRTNRGLCVCWGFVLISAVCQICIRWVVKADWRRKCFRWPPLVTLHAGAHCLSFHSVLHRN